MKTALRNPLLRLLVAGDLLTAGLLTLAGFASHNQLDAGGARMLTTLLPLLASWLLVAPAAGLYRVESAARPRHLLRVAWAGMLAGPLAVTLRGLWLARPVAPVFALVFSASAVLAFVAWRGLFIVWQRKLNRHG